MALAQTVDKILLAAAKLKKAGGNEANTKALLIEPMLAALGWDTTDVDQVEREYRVYDGTALDYALKTEGELRLFVEAKAVGKQLGDKAFISQTVNYANNEGVIWCVLTNGLAYRVYKTNEPVAMEEKLLFEVDITEAADSSPTEVAQALELLGRGALAEGRLEAWGERVFTDQRVRDTLVRLAVKPPAELTAMLEKALGKPEVPAARLHESLGRIFDVESPRPLPTQLPVQRERSRQRRLRVEARSFPSTIISMVSQRRWSISSSRSTSSPEALARTSRGASASSMSASLWANARSVRSRSNVNALPSTSASTPRRRLLGTTGQCATCARLGTTAWAKLSTP